MTPADESSIVEQPRGDASAPLSPQSDADHQTTAEAEAEAEAEQGTRGPNYNAGPTPYLLETLSDAGLSKYLADMKKPPDPGTKPQAETADAEACRTCGVASRMFARGREGTGTEATAVCAQCGGRLHWACAMLDGNNWLPRAPGHPTAVICADCLLRLRRDGRPQLTTHMTARELPETGRTAFLEAFLARSVREEVARAAAEHGVPEEEVPQPRGSLHVREVQSRRNPGHPSPLLDAAFPGDGFARPGSYLERTTLVFQQDGDDDLPVILFGLITNESDQSTAPPHQGWAEISYVESTRHLDLHPPPSAAAAAIELKGSPGGRPRSRSSSVGGREHSARRSKRKRGVRGHAEEQGGLEKEEGQDQDVTRAAACPASTSACPSPSAAEEPGDAEGEKDSTKQQQQQQQQEQQQQEVTMSTVVAGALLAGQLAWWSGSGCRRVSLWSWPPGDGRAYMFLGPTRPTAMDRSKLLAWHRNWLNRAMASPRSVVASVCDGLPGQEWELQGMPRFRGQWWLRRAEQMLARKSPPATLQNLRRRLVKKAKDEGQAGHFLRIELHRSDGSHASSDSAAGGGGGGGGGGLAGRAEGDGAEGERLNAACPDREALLALQCSLGLSFQTRRLAVYSTAVLISRLHYGLEQGGAAAAEGAAGEATEEAATEGATEEAAAEVASGEAAVAAAALGGGSGPSQ